MSFTLHLKLLPLKSLNYIKYFSLVSFRVNFQVLNTSSTIQVMDHYIAANSLFVSQIL